MTTDKIRKDIRDLNTKKAQIDSDIPAKLLVESGDIVSDYITKIYNHSKNACTFDNSLKFGTVIPINKTTTKTTNKKDYRPVSLLPLVCKIYERIMHDEYVQKSTCVPDKFHNRFKSSLHVLICSHHKECKENLELVEKFKKNVKVQNLLQLKCGHNTFV